MTVLSLALLLSGPEAEAKLENANNKLRAKIAGRRGEEAGVLGFIAVKKKGKWEGRFILKSKTRLQRHNGGCRFLFR